MDDGPIILGGCPGINVRLDGGCPGINVRLDGGRLGCCGLTR